MPNFHISIFAGPFSAMTAVSIEKRKGGTYQRE
jgi:hypothetical protein